MKECTQPVKAASYKAMVRPIPQNAATVLDPMQNNQIKKLEQVQRRAARFVYDDYSIMTPGSVTDMLKDLNWESLESRRTQNKLCMMYKTQNGLVDIPAETFLHKSDARTQGQQRLYQNRVYDVTLASSVFIRTVPEWNQLRTSTVTAPSLDAFKARFMCKIYQCK